MLRLVDGAPLRLLGVARHVLARVHRVVGVALVLKLASYRVLEDLLKLRVAHSRSYRGASTLLLALSGVVRPDTGVALVRVLLALVVLLIRNLGVLVLEGVAEIGRCSLTHSRYHLVDLLILLIGSDRLV